MTVDDRAANAFESGLESCYFVACEQPDSVDMSQTVSNCKCNELFMCKSFVTVF